MTLEQLARLQADFAAALNGSDETALEAWVTSGQARQGIDHYRRRLEAQQQRTLGLIYPKLREQLAPRVFAQLCEQYGHRHPSTEGDLGLFGDRLGDFLERQPAFGSGSDLALLARLEWAVHHSNRAANTPALSATEILANSQAGLQHEVRLHPACQLLTSSWPAYHAYTHSTPANAGQALPQFLVHRLRWQVWVRWVPPYEYASLQALQAGCSLEKAMLVAYDHHPIDCPDAQRIEQSGALLRRWVMDQLLVV